MSETEVQSAIENGKLTEVRSSALPFRRTVGTTSPTRELTDVRGVSTICQNAVPIHTTKQAQNSEEEIKTSRNKMKIVLLGKLQTMQIYLP